MNTIQHSLNNACAFLRTEMEPKSRPLLLFVADRILNPIAYTEIDSRGFPVSIIREISPEYDCLQNSDYSQYNTISSIGVGIFGAYLFTGSLSTILFESNFSTLLTFTCVSFSARIIYEKLISFIDNNFNVGTSHNIKKVAFAALSTLSAMTMTFYIIATSSTILTCLHTFSITPILMLASNSIKLFAFNFFAGAFLKLIAYKVYTSVQNAYDNYFTLLKTGEKDPRGNRDIVLRNSFNVLKAEEIDGNKDTPTFFGNLPFDILREIRKFLSSTKALELRSCSKVFFHLTSNQDFLKIRIYENYIFKSATMDETETAIKLREKINKTTQDFLLLLLNTYPLDPSLKGPSLYFIMKKDSKIFWKKTPDNKTECGKIIKGNPFFTKDLLKLEA